MDHRVCWQPLGLSSQKGGDKSAQAESVTRRVSGGSRIRLELPRTIERIRIAGLRINAGDSQTKRQNFRTLVLLKRAPKCDKLQAVKRNAVTEIGHRHHRSKSRRITDLHGRAIVAGRSSPRGGALSAIPGISQAVVESRNVIVAGANKPGTGEPMNINAETNRAGPNVARD